MVGQTHSILDGDGQPISTREGEETDRMQHNDSTATHDPQKPGDPTIEPLKKTRPARQSTSSILPMGPTCQTARLRERMPGYLFTCGRKRTPSASMRSCMRAMLRCMRTAGRSGRRGCRARRGEGMVVMAGRGEGELPGPGDARAAAGRGGAPPACAPRSAPAARGRSCRTR